MNRRWIYEKFWLNFQEALSAMKPLRSNGLILDLLDTDISIPHSLLSYLPRMDHMQLREVLKTEDS